MVGQRANDPTVEMTEELHQVVPAGHGDLGAARLDGDDAETGGVAKTLRVDGLGEARRVQGGVQDAGLSMSVCPDPADGGHGAESAFAHPTISACSVGKAQACPPSSWNAHRQGFDAPHETGIHPLRLAHHLDLVETLQHLLLYDLQLQCGEPHADAAMNAEAERQMRAGPGAVNDEIVGILDAIFVAIARDVPHYDPVALADF